MNERKFIALSDEEIEKNVAKLLIFYGVNPKLKGYDYMKDIIMLGRKKLKYSIATFEQLEEEIALKYGIKKWSVQRQLRYAVTIKNMYGKKIYPKDLMQIAFNKIKTERECNKNEKNAC